MLLITTICCKDLTKCLDNMQIAQLGICPNPKVKNKNLHFASFLAVFNIFTKVPLLQLNQLK